METLDERVTKLAEEVKNVKDRLDVMMYNMVAMDAMTKFMLLNQNQVTGDLATLNTVLREITDIIDERMGAPHEPSDNADEEEDYDHDADADADEDDEPTGALN